MARVDIVLCAVPATLSRYQGGRQTADEAVDQGTFEAERIFGDSAQISVCDSESEWEGRFARFWERRGLVAVRPEQAGETLLDACDLITSAMLQSC